MKGKDISPRSIRVKLSLTEVLYNCCIASANFRTVFLQSLGIGVGQIGIITSLSTVTNIIAPPVWGVISDKIRSNRICFMLCLALTALCMLFVPVCAQVGAPLYIGVVVCLVISTLFAGPANNMMEMWLVQVDNSKIGISYGSIRLWASLGYAAMGLLFVPILERVPISTVYIFYFLFAIPAILLAMSVPEVRSDGQTKKEKIRFRDMPFKKIFNYWIAVYILFSVVNTVPNNWKTTYFIYVLNEYGYESVSFGLFMGLSAVCEVPGLLFSRKIIDRFGVVKPLLCCLAGMVVETALYAFGTSIVHIVIGQTIKGLGFGLMMACQMQLVYRLAHKGLETTTQALIGSIGSIVVIVVSAVGGYMLEAMGIRPFYGLIVGLEAFAAVLLAAGLFVGARVMKKPLPANI